MNFFRLFLLLVAWSAFGAMAPAASLVKLELIPDGSITPPGDRLDVNLLFHPGDKTVTLEVRAYVVSGDDNEKRELVPSRSKASRDEKGGFRLTTTVGKPKTTDIVTTRIVIPYQDLDLTKGNQQIGYVVTGSRDGKAEFVTASPLTLVILGEKTRKTIRVREVVTKAVEGEREVTGCFAQKTKGGKIELDWRVAMLPTKTTVSSVKTRNAKVEIPLGYERAAILEGMQRAAILEGMQWKHFRVDDAPLNAREDFLARLDGQPWVALAEFSPKPNRTVYFATNRKEVNPKAAPAKRFGADSAGDTVTYGACVVNIPVRQHKPGNIEVPSWWNRRDPNKYFLLEVLAKLEDKDFLKIIKGSEADLLVYVHGYDNTFEDAALRSAQLNHDLSFPGKVMFFSWPSVGGTFGIATYNRDETQAADSYKAFAKVLEDLLKNRPIGANGKPGRIHLIAHSMGNRVLLNALHQVVQKAPANAQKQFGHILLAAPDLGGMEFAGLISEAKEAAESVTHYYCQADKALTLSQRVHVDRRVGQWYFFIKGIDMDNVDCVNANTSSFFGHDYYASSAKLHIDLKRLLLFGMRPPQRGLIEGKDPRNYVYWTIP